MGIKLYVTVSEEGHYDRNKKNVTLVKDVAWPAPPPAEGIVFVGADEGGENQGINAHVKRVNWISDGTVEVECWIEHARDEYDAIVADLGRDDFA